VDAGLIKGSAALSELFFFYRTPVRGVFPIFFLIVQHNFDNIHWSELCGILCVIFYFSLVQRLVVLV
jgi:hypothetical protein